MHIVIGLADRARSRWSLGDPPRKEEFAIQYSEICRSEKIYNAGHVTGRIEILPNIKVLLPLVVPSIATN